MVRRAFVLTVDGAVHRTLSLSCDDLLALPAIEREVKLDCGKGTSTVSTVRGPPLACLIDLAGASDSANRAVFYCADGHRETMSLADLLGCEAFFALRLGEDATGGPGVRLVVPGKFGERWAKYVERIEIIADV